MNVMCNMVKVNCKIYCRKNKNKFFCRLIGLKKFGVYEMRDLFLYVFFLSEYVKIVCFLEFFKYV